MPNITFNDLTAQEADSFNDLLKDATVYNCQMIMQLLAREHANQETINAQIAYHKSKIAAYEIIVEKLKYSE